MRNEEPTAAQRRPLRTPHSAFRIVDVLNARILDLAVGSEPARIACDLLICGGGMGGVAAAIRAAARGLSVCVIEETDWIGGQMTAQGVSALDEHRWIEQFGATAGYSEMRRRIREHYRPLLKAPSEPGLQFNPGNAWVSRLCFEPRVGLQVLESMLRPAIDAGRLRVLLRTRAARVSVRDGAIAHVDAVQLDTGAWTRFEPRYVIDATELGDLLPLAGEEWTVGAEPASATGEPHASTARNSAAQAQSFTCTFALAFEPGGDHRIEKPPGYDRFARAGKYSFYYSYPDVEKRYKMFVLHEGAKPFWTYRRLIDAAQFRPGAFAGDVAMINWQGNDYCGAGLYSLDPQRQLRALKDAKLLALGFLYWLQTEAPRDEGGRGYPELRLLPEVMGTADGLSKFPYIRESRRARTLDRVVEQDISAEFQKAPVARSFENSVGIGHYFLDLHVCAGPRFSAPTKPFQIPLGLLVPRRTRNLLLGCKNVGTTHLTNGAYRLHPIEWAIGEAAGELAAFAVHHGKLPREVHADQRLTAQLQESLREAGIPTEWPLERAAGLADGRNPPRLTSRGQM